MSYLLCKPAVLYRLYQLSCTVILFWSCVVCFCICSHILFSKSIVLFYNFKVSFCRPDIWFSLSSVMFVSCAIMCSKSAILFCRPLVWTCRLWVWATRSPVFFFFSCRRESAKDNKNKTKGPTLVPVPGKSRFSSQKNGISVLIPLSWNSSSHRQVETQKQGESSRVSQRKGWKTENTGLLLN